MTDVYQVYSRFQIPVTDLEETINNRIDFPDEIEAVQIEHINGQLQLQSVPVDDDVGRYTPTAVLKAGLTEKRVVVEDDGTVTHLSVSNYQKDSGWGRMADQEEELDTTVIEYADFYGYEDEVLINDVLRAEMFDVLCDLSSIATRGHVEGIVLEDDTLEPVWYRAGGEEVDAEITLEESGVPSDEEEDESVMSWSQHE